MAKGQGESLWDDAPVDISKETGMIWDIANTLRGLYTADKYKDVIIPMTIIRRLECALAPTKDAVVKKYNEDKNFPEESLYRISGYQFYNTSKFTLVGLKDDANLVAKNFEAYIKGFSNNVQEIIKSLDFETQIKKMDEGDRLLPVVLKFAELDLDPEHIDSIKMGYIFEDLIRRFSENVNAGDHYTGRDIIRLMVSLALAEGADDIMKPRKIVKICDQAAGTGGMLSTAYSYIRHLNPKAEVRLYAQEVNAESFAECYAEMLIKGQDAKNIRNVNTFMTDCFPNEKMRLVLENPPFGTPWGGKDAPVGSEKAVKKSYEERKRWPAGLPGTGDAQLIFLQSAIDKMDDKVGRAVIVENGSPLFSGGTSSGESRIRRWLLEHDLIEAIVALPTEIFYNTGIQTYLWVLSKNKRKERRGKVQLIDASSFCHPLRRSLGYKRNEISPEDRERVTEIYKSFEESELCKIFDNEDFMYREYAVMQPLQRSYSITPESIERLKESGKLSSLYDAAAVYRLESMAEEDMKDNDKKRLKKFTEQKPLYDEIIELLEQSVSDEKYLEPDAFMPVLRHALATVIAPDSVKKSLLEKIADGLSIMDKSAVIQRDKDGNIIYDKETKDVEIVPYKEKIDDYMAREVLPFVPDAKAFFEEDLTKNKPVIKTGAEIPFTRYFYHYEAPKPSKELGDEFIALEKETAAEIASLFA